MKAFLLVSMIALSSAAVVPTAEAESCFPNPRFVQVCQSHASGVSCYDVYVMDEHAYGFCIA